MARILVVDNNLMNLQFITYLLIAKGHQTITANNVNEGMDLAEQVPVNLIISDLNLPQRNGFSFLKQVKQHQTLRDVPFVILTSTSRSPKDVDEAHQLGAAKFIHRPIEPEVLLAELAPYLPKKNIN